MKKGLYQHICSYALIIIISAMAFATTGCGICSDCKSEKEPENTKKNKKQREMLAGKQSAENKKAGMIFAFNKEEDNNAQQAAGLATTAVYKDLSMHYNLPEEKSCPLGLQSNHTNFTAGPNINFKSAGEDVYAEGSHKPGIGFQAGFKTEYRFNDQFSVVSGLLFKQNNAKEEGTISDGGEPPYYYTAKIEDNYSYSYLSAPIVAQYNLTEALSVSAGPEVNYLLKSKVKSKITSEGETQNSKEDLTKNSVRVGMGVQVGVKYAIPDSRWGLELVYDHRLSRLNKKNPEGYGNYEVPAWRMKSIQLGATLRICDLVKGPKHTN